MIRLTSTEKLQAVLAGAISTTQPQAVACFSDQTATAYSGGKQLTALNSTTDVDIVAAPAASAVRDVDYLSIYNRDTASVTVTVKYDVSGVDSVIITVTLLTLETLEYTHSGGWWTLDSQGRIKTSTTALTGVLGVANGGTGQSTLTDGGLLVGNGTNGITQLGVATNGQLPIGSTGADPAIATLTGTANQVTVTNGAGSITLSGPQDLATTSSPTFTGITATGLVDISGSSAGQIKFPASQNPSANANTLDDYEEGTFTATATASSSGTITLDLASCTYTKVGRNVNVYGIIRVSAISAPTGIMHLNGMPFTIGDWAGLAVYADALAATAIEQIMGYFEPATTRIGLFKYSAGATTGLADNIAVNSVFMLAGSYRV